MCSVRFLNVFLDTTEMNVQFVEVLQEYSEGCSFGHFCKCVHVFRETFSAITEFTIGSRDVGVGVVDVAGEEYAGVDFAPVSTHFLAILAASVEIGYFVGTKDIVHVLGELCLQRAHHCEFLANENLR